MHSREPKARDGAAMYERAIALVDLKSVLRILGGNTLHVSIPHHLGNDRRHRNHRLRIISADNCFLIGESFWGHESPVEQNFAFLRLCLELEKALCKCGEHSIDNSMTINKRRGGERYRKRKRALVPQFLNTCKH